jgi:hypothetical protein
MTGVGALPLTLPLPTMGGGTPLDAGTAKGAGGWPCGMPTGGGCVVNKKHA